LSPMVEDQSALVDAEIGRLCRLKMAEAAMSRDVPSRDMLPDITLVPSMLDIGSKPEGPLSRVLPSQPTRSLQVPQSSYAAPPRTASSDASSDALQRLIVERERSYGGSEESSRCGVAPSGQEDIETRIRRLEEERTAVLQRLGERREQYVSDRIVGVESTLLTPGTSSISSPSAPRGCSTRSRVQFKEMEEDGSVVPSRPPAQGSRPQPQYAVPDISSRQQRPNSPWTTSSSAYGGHSSASSASTSPSNAGPGGKGGKARLDAARLRTLALRSRV